MAHKHNRRRVRPRSRHHPSLSLSNLATSPSGPFDLSSSISPTPSGSLPQSLLSSQSSISARHWQNRYTAWQNREVAQKREAIKIEAEQLKLFGGEPGDDVGLCYKMLEVFEGMEWIDA